ncbi:UNKNOWN [Stylonychia lemnae]|uniref:Uncharacterized protein n=1 Tax=Stylonychia lemnae TaxID=5949 RepID=A0A078AVX5_STYLE|nr:UNKNOWN [Stylonychia lemnae]|eukprot:CDW86329.1 UNKNOWN [Stylonychia lemnae]
MLVHTDYCIPSGKGTSMYSRKGAQTIAFHLCFRSDQREKFKKIIEDKESRNTLENSTASKFKSMHEIKEYLEDCYKNKRIKKKRATSFDINGDQEIGKSVSETNMNNASQTKRDSYFRLTEGVPFNRYNPQYSQIIKNSKAVHMRSGSVKEEMILKRKQRQEMLLQLKQNSITAISNASNNINQDKNEKDSNANNDSNSVQGSQTVFNKDQILKKFTNHLLEKYQKQENQSHYNDFEQSEFSFNSLDKKNNASYNKSKDQQVQNKNKPLLHLRRTSIGDESSKAVIKKSETLYKKQNLLNKKTNSQNTIDSKIIESKDQDYEPFNPYDVVAQTSPDVNLLKRGQTLKQRSRIEVIQPNNYSKSFKQPLHQRQNFLEAQYQTFNIFPNQDEYSFGEVKEKRKNFDESNIYNDDHNSSFNKSFFKKRDQHSTKTQANQTISHIRLKSAISQKTMVDMDRQAGRNLRSLSTQKLESKIERLNKIRQNQLVTKDKNVTKFSPKIVKKFSEQHIKKGKNQALLLKLLNSDMITLIKQQKKTIAHR